MLISVVVDKVDETVDNVEGAVEDTDDVDNFEDAEDVVNVFVDEYDDDDGDVDNVVLPDTSLVSCCADEFDLLPAILFMISLKISDTDSRLTILD